MHTNERLFPDRLTRRDFLKTAGTATVSVAAGLTQPATGKETQPAIRLGSGYHTYEVVARWGQLPKA